MNLRVLKRLHDALDSAEAVASFIAGKTQQDYLSYRLLRSAVERELEKAGEALFVARRDDPDLIQKLPELHQIIGLRHRFVHGYDALIDAEIWSMAEVEAPRPAIALRPLVQEHRGPGR